MSVSETDFKFKSGQHILTSLSLYVMLKCVIHRRPAVYDLTGVFALLLVQISLPFSVINVMILLSAASVVYLSMLHTQFMRYNCRCCELKAKLVSHCNC